MREALTFDLCCNILCSPMESIEPTEEALRGRSRRERGRRGYTPAGGRSAQGGRVHPVGLSVKSMGVVTKGILRRYMFWGSTLVTRSWRVTIHDSTYCLVI